TSTMNDLLSLTRMQSDHLDHYDENVELVRLLRIEVLGSLWSLAAKKEVRIITSLPARISLSGSRPMLRDMFYHIIVNAITFSLPKGEVHIEASSEGRETRITIRDNGIGIAKEQLEKVFESFYQVREHLTRDHEGLGLGLTLARHIATYHGGRIELSSTLGEGTTVCIVLPRTSEGL
ncbi:MAG: HAMP domain-containing histidine kinase, partial [Planctomycetes bacterium]|nr:HAMP domain-containing histidine kinase [Planctomycetota bacterium]